MDTQIWLVEVNPGGDLISDLVTIDVPCPGFIIVWLCGEVDALPNEWRNRSSGQPGDLKTAFRKLFQFLDSLSSSLCL